VLEGLNAAMVRAQHPALWLGWLEHRADFELPGGESTRRFYGRIIAALTELTAAHAGQRVAVVTHGGVLDMLWRHMHLASLDGQRICAIPNTGINRLRCVDGQLQLVSWADDGHLQGLP
jgi:2,3-bisphosphoglycerate-dependent phosphoglycerate mutase